MVLLWQKGTSLNSYGEFWYSSKSLPLNINKIVSWSNSYVAMQLNLKEMRTVLEKKTQIYLASLLIQISNPK